MEQTQPEAKRARPPSPQAQAGEPEEDRLSALDDATLHAILARLPLRDAAATTALSRRWPRVFATLPRLSLTCATFNRRETLYEYRDGDEYCDDTNRWTYAIDGILDGRAAPIASFEVQIDFMDAYDDWFYDLFREICRSGGLRELSIWNTNSTDCYKVPSPVYNCPTLTSLELYSCRLRVPGSLRGLRAVRSLQLHEVVATDADIRRMISRCRDVERLVISDIRKARNIVIRASNLEKLEICSYRPLCISVKKALRLDSVKLSLSYGCAELNWSVHDNEDTDGDHSISEIEEMFGFEGMEEREHEQTDEIANMVTFLGGLGSAKTLSLNLETEYSKVLSKAKSTMPKRLLKKCQLLGLQKLTLTMDHNHEAVATLVSCLFNSSPNIKDLEIIDPLDIRYSDPLAAKFWEKQINAECVQNHLSSVTFFMSISLFKGRPCLGLPQFLVMNARVLKRMSIKYHRSNDKPKHADLLETVRE
ncbi:F-box/FBD/LRR-repeat protein At3g26920-like [Phragmites australis]|uniref:F-box/FBD/LRR-repeat protein At3g26920-like n=1 Tax=Phragmites australis TaxID=29695 RepID=UPI002D779B88|nr:F-box/FBD/LRR-repeat protein At3g26920-like [Phragmites australis]